MNRWKIAGLGLGTGVVIAAALPPWGWWPLAFAGIVAFDRLIADVRWSQRFHRGWAVGLGLYFPSLLWMKDLTLPGYFIATIAYAALLGVAAMAVPPHAPGRWLALPGAVALTELLRWTWPFQGVPLSSLAVGQAAGPLAPVLRVGGALLLVEVTMVAGLLIAAAIRRNWLATGVGGAFVVALVGLGIFGPRASSTGQFTTALVQGGGPQGTRAIDTDEYLVFQRHLEASQRVETPVDLVVWPEDIVDVEGPVETNPEFQQLKDLAAELDAPIVVGVVEGVDSETFRNASIVVQPDGSVTDRYDKVHRVPFGEYVPLRSLIENFSEEISSRDAIIGDGPAELDTPVGKAAIAISWEIFFGDRVREGVDRGGEFVLNPTNGSSFTGTMVQTQQVASSRMRAIENDRWVLQVAPTGFSAVIGPDGTVHQRSSVSEQAVLHATVGTRTGTTLYTRLGLLPAWLVALTCLGSGWFVQRRRREGDQQSKPEAHTVEEAVPLVGATDGT